MISRGKIDLKISKQDIDSLEFQDRAQCYQQTPQSLIYYTPHNSSIYQMFDESPAWIHDLARQLPQDFQHHVVSAIKVEPGQTIPLHRDKHYILRSKFTLEGETFRYLIFLEDWKSGHYFELQGQPLVEWKAGDWIKFSNDHWHLGGNMGQDPFYSAQVTVQ